jgi:hypothetical protein
MESLGDGGLGVPALPQSFCAIGSRYEGATRRATGVHIEKASRTLIYRRPPSSCFGYKGGYYRYGTMSWQQTRVEPDGITVKFTLKTAWAGAMFSRGAGDTRSEPHVGRSHIWRRTAAVAREALALSQVTDGERA